MDYSLHRCEGSHPGFRSLITELDRELRSETSAHDEIFITHNIVPDHVHVVLALLGEQAVGCACLRALNKEAVELKRMFVLPEHRGKGLSRRILEDLELWAKEMKYRAIRLETGHFLKAAHSLYRSSGFRTIENYGPYKGIAESLCFEKVLEERE